MGERNGREKEREGGEGDSLYNGFPLSLSPLRLYLSISLSLYLSASVCLSVFLSLCLCLSSHLNNVRVSDSAGHVHWRLTVRTRLKEEGKEGRRRERRKKERKNEEGNKEGRRREK